MKGAQGMVALVLDQTSSEVLKALTKHSDVYCYHVTMAYRPTPDVYAKYAPMLGQRMTALVATIYSDQLGQAAVVEGVPSEKEVPHVTMSCREGVKPSYSNDMFHNPARSEDRIQLGLRGTVKWVPL